MSSANEKRILTCPVSERADYIYLYFFTRPSNTTDVYIFFFTKYNFINCTYHYIMPICIAMV